MLNVNNNISSVTHGKPLPRPIGNLVSKVDEMDIVGMSDLLSAPGELVTNSKALAERVTHVAEAEPKSLARKIVDLVASIFNVLSSVGSNIRLAFEFILPESDSGFFGVVLHPLNALASLFELAGKGLFLSNLNEKEQKRKEKIFCRTLWKLLNDEAGKPVEKRDYSHLQTVYKNFKEAWPQSRGVARWKERLVPQKLEEIIAKKRKSFGLKKEKAALVLENIESWKKLVIYNSKEVDPAKRAILKKYYESKLAAYRRKGTKRGSPQEKEKWEKKAKGAEEKLVLLTASEKKGERGAALARLQRRKGGSRRKSRWERKSHEADLYRVCNRGASPAIKERRFSLLIDQRLNESTSTLKNAGRDRMRCWVSLALNVAIFATALLSIGALIASLVTGGALIPVTILAVAGSVATVALLANSILNNHLWKQKKGVTLEELVKKELVEEKREEQTELRESDKKKSSSSSSTLPFNDRGEVNEPEKAVSTKKSKGFQWKKRALKAKDIIIDQAGRVRGIHSFTKVGTAVANFAKEFVPKNSWGSSFLNRALNPLNLFGKIAMPCYMALTINELVKDAQRLATDKKARVADKFVGIASSAASVATTTFGTAKIAIDLFTNGLVAHPAFGIVSNSLSFIAATLGITSNSLRIDRLRKEKKGSEEKWLQRQMWQTLASGKDLSPAEQKKELEKQREKFTDDSYAANKWKKRLDEPFEGLLADKKLRLLEKEKTAERTLESLKEWKEILDKKGSLNNSSVELLLKFYTKKLEKYKEKAPLITLLSEKEELGKKMESVTNKINVLQSKNGKEIEAVQKKKVRFIDNRAAKWLNIREERELYNLALKEKGPAEKNSLPALLAHRAEAAKGILKNKVREQKRTWISLAVNIVSIAVAIVGLVGIIVALASGGALAIPALIALTLAIISSSIGLSKYLLNKYLWQEKEVPLFKNLFEQQLLRKELEMA